MNNAAMSRRSRRPQEDSGGNGLSSSTQAQSKSESSSLISVCVLFVVTVLFFGYLFGSSAFHHHSKISTASAVATARKLNPSLLLRSVPEEDHPSTENNEEDDHEQSKSTDSKPEAGGALEAIPLLQEVYGKHMKKVIHIGPETCAAVARILRDEGAQAWGVEPSEMANPSPMCKSLVRKGLVRVADVHRGLPYQSKSFSLVLASNTLEHLTSRQLNRTLPELARLTSHAIVAFISSQPSQSAARQLQAALLKPIKSHNRTWWSRRFETAGLDEDEELSKQFANLQSQRSFRSSGYVFHLLPRQLD